MTGSALPRWSSLMVVILHTGLGWAHPVTGSPSGHELQSLEDLLERLKEKVQQGDLEVPSYEAGNADDSSYLDLGDSESHPFRQLDLLPPLPQAEVEAQWRKFLASPKRRRHFSGCFGTRLERIGSQTGLGCKIYKPRKDF
uniref:Natriuretic peptides B-like n=1 Tax=Pogona vitticeps TaxID=103695 RepID=A0A6J0SRW7_9SAUR|nr:natriuretic peptides B-like [Pogona vitticeps]